jgi:hypothetical protein
MMIVIKSLTGFALASYGIAYYKLDFIMVGLATMIIACIQFSEKRIRRDIEDHERELDRRLSRIENKLGHLLKK